MRRLTLCSLIAMSGCSIDISIKPPQKPDPMNMNLALEKVDQNFKLLAQAVEKQDKKIVVLAEKLSGKSKR